MSKPSPTDAASTLGTIIGPDAKRDAIHVAVEPMVAAHTLRPGDHVGFVEGGAGTCDDPVGIVDPFLDRNVRKGERFWLFVYPRQTTGLRHVWSHPKFDEVPDTVAVVAPIVAPVKADVDPSEVSRQWINDFAGRIGQSYASLMQAANRWILGEDFTRDNRQGYGGHEGDFPEFWNHFEIVTGRDLPETVERQSFFTCSC